MFSQQILILVVFVSSKPRGIRKIVYPKGCPYFTSELKSCDICGNVILKDAIVDEEEGKTHYICQKCAIAPRCQNCVNNTKCRFKTDTSCSEPQTITTQRRRGNMVIQTQIMNPKRIKATCAQGCSCYWDGDPENEDFCLKQIGCGCNNYKINWRN